MAATILTRDPTFDWFAYGGMLKVAKDSLSVVPRDGLRQRFHAILDEPEAAARQSRYQRSADSLVRESPAGERSARTRLSALRELSLHATKWRNTDRLQLCVTPSGCRHA